MNIPTLSIGRHATIKEALAIINLHRIALVVDQDNRLVGTITDGDIRRALLDGRSLEDSIEEIYNPHPTTCPVTALKETILRTAVEKWVKQIPIVDKEGRVVRVEIIEELLQPKRHTNHVVIMAGGLGTRLRPLTDNIPKPLLKIENRPILEKILIDFVRQGFRHFTFCVNYKADMIRSHFKDGSRFGAHIEYIQEKEKLGTAGALSTLRDKMKEPFIVMNGDILTELDFSTMLDYHLKQGAFATMGVREYEVQVPYGVVKIEEDHIVGIEEKPLHSFFVSGGIYVLDPKALEFIPHNTFFDMPELFEKLVQEGHLCIPYPIREYWLDIGSMSDFHKANSDVRIARIMANYRQKERE